MLKEYFKKYTRHVLSQIPIVLVLLDLHFEGIEGIDKAESQRHLSLGNQLLNAGNLAEALTHFHTSIDKDDKNYQAYYMRATVYLAMGKARSALPDLNQVVKLQPAFVQARMQRGNLFMKMGNFNEAQTDYESVLAQEDHQEAKAKVEEIRPLRRNVNHASKLLEAADFHGSINLLNQVIESCPWNAYYREMRALAYERLGDLRRAISDLKPTTVLKLDNTRAFLKMSVLWYNLGEVEQSLEEIRECLKLDPDHSECYSHYKSVKKLFKTLEAAKRKMAESDWSEAIVKYRKALSQESRIPQLNVEIKLKICECFVKAHDPVEAIEAAEDVLDIDDNSIPAFLLLSEAHTQNEEYQEAVDDLQKAAQIDENYPGLTEKIKKAQKLLKQSQKRDYYKILGVSRNAGKQEIIKAYRKLARDWHPDSFQSEEDKKRAEKKFIEIAAAKEVLSDPEKVRILNDGYDPMEVEDVAEWEKEQALGRSGNLFEFFFQHNAGGEAKSPHRPFEDLFRSFSEHKRQQNQRDFEEQFKTHAQFDRDAWQKQEAKSKQYEEQAYTDRRQQGFGDRRQQQNINPQQQQQQRNFQQQRSDSQSQQQRNWQQKQAHFYGGPQQKTNRQQHTDGRSQQHHFDSREKSKYGADPRQQHTGQQYSQQDHTRNQQQRSTNQQQENVFSKKQSFGSRQQQADPRHQNQWRGTQRQQGDSARWSNRDPRQGQERKQEPLYHRGEENTQRRNYDQKRQQHHDGFDERYSQRKDPELKKKAKRKPSFKKKKAMTDEERELTRQYTQGTDGKWYHKGKDGRWRVHNGPPPKKRPEEPRTSNQEKAGSGGKKSDDKSYRDEKGNTYVRGSDGNWYMRVDPPSANRKDVERDPGANAKSENVARGQQSSNERSKFKEQDYNSRESAFAKQQQTQADPRYTSDYRQQRRQANSMQLPRGLFYNERNQITDRIGNIYQRSVDGRFKLVLTASEARERLKDQLRRHKQSDYINPEEAKPRPKQQVYHDASGNVFVKDAHGNLLRIQPGRQPESPTQQQQQQQQPQHQQRRQQQQQFRQESFNRGQERYSQKSPDATRGQERWQHQQGPHHEERARSSSYSEQQRARQQASDHSYQSRHGRESQQTRFTGHNRQFQSGDQGQRAERQYYHHGYRQQPRRPAHEEL